MLSTAVQTSPLTFTCLVNSDLVGNGILGVLGMGMGCKQSAKGPSGPPGDAVAVASFPGNWIYHDQSNETLLVACTGDPLCLPGTTWGLARQLRA